MDLWLRTSQFPTGLMMYVSHAFTSSLPLSPTLFIPYTFHSLPFLFSLIFFPLHPPPLPEHPQNPISPPTPIPPSQPLNNTTPFPSTTTPLPSTTYSQPSPPRNVQQHRWRSSDGVGQRPVVQNPEVSERISSGTSSPGSRTTDDHHVATREERTVTDADSLRLSTLPHVSPLNKNITLVCIWEILKTHTLS